MKIRVLIIAIKNRSKTQRLLVMEDCLQTYFLIHKMNLSTRNIKISIPYLVKMIKNKIQIIIVKMCFKIKHKNQISSQI